MKGTRQHQPERLSATAVLGSVGALFAGAAMMSTTALGQTDSDSETSAATLEEVVVTARRREESLIDVPLSVSVFSGDDLERGAMNTLEDVSNFTPGMDFKTALDGPGRLDGNIRMRGVVGGGPRNATTSVYVDGIYALQAGQSLAIVDLERVEVIKGPQSASFGRNAFAGSVNYVTSSPSLNEFSGNVKVDAGQYEHYIVSARLDIPLITDKLAMRVGARLYNQGAMYTASDGGGLGEESSESAFVTLFSEPTENLSLKFRAYYQEDEDGPASTFLFRGVDYDTCSGTSYQGLDSDGNPATLYPQEFICGRVPNPGEPGAPIVDLNTTMRPQIFPPGYEDFLIDNLDAIGEDVSGVPSLDFLGLKREITRVSLSGEYVFDNEFMISAVAAYNENRASTFRDFDLTPYEAWWVSNPQAGEDTSIDIKLTSPVDSRLRWLIGASAYSQDFKGQGDGDLIHTCGNFVAISDPTAGTPCDYPVRLAGAPISGDYVDVWGIYGMVSFDITDKLTVDFEGRYQEDTRSTAQDLTFEEVYKDFVPRVSLTYKATDNLTAYVVYAEGLLPGQVNGNLISCNDTTYSEPFISPITGLPSTSSECDQWSEQLGDDAKDITDTQTLDSWEVGIKSVWLDGQFLLNLSAYHQEWVNRPYSSFGQIVRDDDGDGIPNPIANNLSISLPGSAEYQGIEAEAWFRLTDYWDAGFTLSYNDSEYTKLIVPGLNALSIFGTNYVTGNPVEGFPEWMGSLSTTYRWPSQGGDWEYFTRGDAIYRGKTWTGSEHLAYIDDYVLVNIRGGLEWDNFNIELYVSNLFDEDTWVTGSTSVDFSRYGNGFDFAHQGIRLVPQAKRSVGIRAGWSF